MPDTPVVARNRAALCAACITWADEWQDECRQQGTDPAASDASGSDRHDRCGPALGGVWRD